MKTSVVSVTFALVASTLALSVTSPTSKSVWNFQQKNTVTWTSVSTDPSIIDIILVDESVHPALNVPVANGVQTSSGSMTLNAISGITPGSGYQINLVNPVGLSILAQSPDFNVSGSLGQETASGGGSSTVSSTVSSIAPSASSFGSASSILSLPLSGANSTAVAAPTSGSSSLATTTNANATASASIASATNTSIYSGFSITGSSRSATGTSTASASSSSSSSIASATGVTFRSVCLGVLVVGVAALFA